MGCGPAPCSTTPDRKRRSTSRRLAAERDAGQPLRVVCTCQYAPAGIAFSPRKSRRPRPGAESPAQRPRWRPWRRRGSPEHLLAALVVGGLDLHGGVGDVVVLAEQVVGFHDAV